MQGGGAGTASLGRLWSGPYLLMHPSLSEPIEGCIKRKVIEAHTPQGAAASQT
jgi:hypothetical protein